MYGNFDKKAYLEVMEEEYNPNKNKRATITISMEEYKELLIIKGKYEELKKQLEEINKMIEKCGFVNIEQIMLNYCGLLKQQKEFINYLEEKIKTLEKDILETIDDMDIYMKQVKSLIIEEILQKYKEIIGVSDENNQKRN